MTARTKKNVLLWSALAMLGVPALAVGTSVATPNAAAQQNTAGSAQARRPALQVKYYDANPLAGGKLLATKTLQPPTRPAQNTPGTPGAAPTNPLLASAPAGAKFAVIADGRGAGAIVIDLSQPDLGRGPWGGRDGGRGGGPGGHHGGRGPGGWPGAPGTLPGTTGPGTATPGTPNSNNGGTSTL